MGFSDLVSDAGLTLLDSWTKTHTYILGHAPSQADVKVFQAVGKSPAVERFPHAYRWYKHVASFDSDFSTLPGDASKDVSTYGPEASSLPINPAAAPAAAAADDDDDDEVDLFGSDEESDDEETKKLKEQRLADYAAKKAGKTKPAAKSIVTLDVKPWDDETDMVELERLVRSVEKDGLVWGGSKLVPVGYGVRKIQINLVCEDDKVSIEELQEEIEAFSDFTQSVDVVAMQKL